MPFSSSCYAGKVALKTLIGSKFENAGVILCFYIYIVKILCENIHNVLLFSKQLCSVNL